jgi:hypothetical protein
MENSMKRRNIMKKLAFLASFLVAPTLFAHGGHDHVMGTVTAVTETRLDVKTSEGKTLTIRLTGETKYEKEKKPATVKDLKPGVRVVVDADRDKEALVAKEVKIGSDSVIYTCPMHPEVKETAPGKCPKCGMNLKPKS